MVIETTRFGKIDVGPEDIITFPEGMLGFSKIQKYVLLEGSDDSLFLWLQAVKKGSIAFPLLEPEIFEPQYALELHDQDREQLEIEDLADIKVFSIVTIPSDPSKMTANLRAPVVLNLKNRMAKQVILENEEYPIRKAIFAQLQNYCAAQSRSIFPGSEASAYHAVHIQDEKIKEQST